VTTPHEAEVTSSNPSSPIGGHVKKKKKKKLNINAIISLSAKLSIKTKKTITSKARNRIICHLNLLICSVREKSVNFDVEIDLGMSNETHVTNRKLLTLTVK
jgi:hypothetical protein